MGGEGGEGGEGGGEVELGWLWSSARVDNLSL